MGHQRLSSGTRSYAPTQRLAGGAHRSQVSLPLVFFGLHALLRFMRSGLVGELVDRISHPPGHERRTDGSVDADDDGACCGKACGAPHGLRGCANPAGADPWPGHRRCHSATRLLALALPGQSAGRCIGNRPGGSLSAHRSRRDQVKRTRSSWLRPALSRTRALPLWVRSSGRAYRSYGSPGFHRSACALLQNGNSQRRSGTHRPAAIQKQNLLCVRHHAVHVKRNLVRRPNADSDLSHPRLWPIAERDGLVAGSAWSGDDLFLSMDGNSYAAVRNTKDFWWRRTSSFRGHAAISLSVQSRTCSLRARMRSVPTRSGPKRSRHSLHLGGLRFSQEGGSAYGDNVSQYCAASRGTDTNDVLCDFPGMEVGRGTFVRRSHRRIYGSLSSTLRPARFPVCCRAKASSFHRQSDTTNPCTRSACHSGNDVRVIAYPKSLTRSISTGKRACRYQLQNCCHAEVKTRSPTQAMPIGPVSIDN